MFNFTSSMIFIRNKTSTFIILIIIVIVTANNNCHIINEIKKFLFVKICFKIDNLISKNLSVNDLKNFNNTNDDDGI